MTFASALATLLCAVPPAPANPAEVLPARTAPADLMTIDVDPKMEALLLKYQKGTQANPEVFRELLATSKPGEPLDYDERLGLTREEYKLVVEKANAAMSLRKVGDLLLTVAVDPSGKRRLSSPKPGTVLPKGVVYDPKTNAAAFDAIAELGAATPFKTEKGGLAPLVGFTWKAESSTNLDLSAATLSTFELIAARMGEPGKCLIVVRAQKAENGQLQLNEYVMLRFDCPK